MEGLGLVGVELFAAGRPVFVVVVRHEAHPMRVCVVHAVFRCRCIPLIHRGGWVWKFLALGALVVVAFLIPNRAWYPVCLRLSVLLLRSF